MSIHNNPSAHIIALSLEDVKEQSDAILRGSNELPDAVLVRWIFSRPPRAGDWAIQLRDETSTGSWMKKKDKDHFGRLTSNIISNLNIVCIAHRIKDRRSSLSLRPLFPITSRQTYVTFIHTIKLCAVSSHSKQDVLIHLENVKMLKIKTIWAFFEFEFWMTVHYVILISSIRISLYLHIDMPVNLIALLLAFHHFFLNYDTTRVLKNAPLVFGL